MVTALENGAKPNEVVTFSESQAACIACLGLGGQEGVFRAGDQSYAQSGPGYEATLSAAIDRLEKIGITASASDPTSEAAGSGSGSPVSESLEGTEWQNLLLATDSRLPERWKNEHLKCECRTSRGWNCLSTDRGLSQATFAAIPAESERWRARSSTRASHRIRWKSSAPGAMRSSNAARTAAAAEDVSLPDGGGAKVSVSRFSAMRLCD